MQIHSNIRLVSSSHCSSALLHPHEPLTDSQTGNSLKNINLRYKDCKLTTEDVFKTHCGNYTASPCAVSPLSLSGCRSFCSCPLLSCSSCGARASCRTKQEEIQMEVINRVLNAYWKESSYR